MMPVGTRREIENLERTIAICERFKKRIAAGDDQAAIIADLAADYGVQKPAIWRQVHKGLPAFSALAQKLLNSVSEAEYEPEPDDPGMIIEPRAWCAQCDKGVTHARIALCRSPFCKAKSAIAAAAREGGDAQQAPGNAPQSGGTAASPDLPGGIA